MLGDVVAPHPAQEPGSGRVGHGLLAVQQPGDDELGEAPRLEFGLERLAVVMVVDPVEEGCRRPGVEVGIGLHEVVQQAGFRVADVEVAEAEMRLRLLGRAAVQQDVERRADARTVGAGLAVKEHRPLGGVEDVLQRVDLVRAGHAAE